MLIVRTMDSLKSAPGDFSAALNPFFKEMYLPRDVMKAVWPGLRDGEDGMWFHSFASKSPESLAASLGWSAQDVAAATEKLGALLISEGFLAPEPPKPVPPPPPVKKAGDDMIGARMSDGTICAGASPDTGRLMFVARNDAPLTLTFGQACDYAETADLHGNRDWRMPSPRELKAIYNNLAAAGIGGFDTGITSPGAWYWTAKECGKDIAQGVHMATGSDFTTGKGGMASLRLVRDDTPKKPGARAVDYLPYVPFSRFFS